MRRSLVVLPGATDCTAAFQAQLDATGAAGGGIVEVPAGRFRIAGHLSVPANVTLQGIYTVAPTTDRTWPTPTPLTELTGSVLLAYEGRGSTEGPPFIDLAGHNSAVAGLIIAYPEWSIDHVPPVPFPPCIGSEDSENVSVRDCLLVNPYEAIRLVRAHRHMLRNINGYPIARGIFVDQCYDIGKIENIHFWPFGTLYDPNHPYSKWINTEGVAFELARTDWEYVLNTFCFGYGIGYKFSAYEHGAANGNFHGLGADSCERAVVVEQAQPAGLLLTNGEFVGRWSSTEAVCLEVGPEVQGKVSLTNCSFWGPIDRCIWMRSPTGWLAVNACHFVQWDIRGAGSPALQLDAGRTLVQGSSFAQEALHVQVGPQVASVILTANQASGGFRVDNMAGPRTQTGLNESGPVPPEAWDSAARSHYQIDVGAAGDGSYLAGWRSPERLEQTFRWSNLRSVLMLPVPAGQVVTVTLQGRFPPEAVDAEAGLYLGETRIAPLTAGETLSVELPATTDDRVRLELRCRGWVPQEEHPGSNDPRTLGVLLRRITVRAAGAGEAVFSANTGEWRQPGG